MPRLGPIQNLKFRIQNLSRSKFVRDTITLQAGKLALMAINIGANAILVRGLGDENYGVYALALNLYGLFMAFNLAGLDSSTVTRLSESISARDRILTRDLMGFFLQVSLAMAVFFTVVAWLTAPTIAAVTQDNAAIGELAKVFMLTLFFEPIYQLALIVLQSARAMRSFAVMENSAVLLESALTAAVILLGGGILGVIAARVVGSALRAGIGVWAYLRLRAFKPESLPTVGEVFRAARTNSPRPFWRFGVLLAMDKNVSLFYTLLPVYIVGMWAGEAAAGYLRLALGVLTYPALLFAGVQTNLESRLPADAGRQDYVRLEDNFRRAMRIIAPLAVLIFGAFMLASPLLVWLLYGEEYLPVIAPVMALGVFGVVTSIGGAFAPLYRALRLAGSTLAIKLVTLAAVSLPALWLIQGQGAFGGAWAINLFYAVSVGLTAAVVWSRLRKLAEKQREETSGERQEARKT